MAAASSRQVFDKRSIVGRASLAAATLSITAEATLNDLMKQTGANLPTITDYVNDNASPFYYNDYGIESIYSVMINDNLSNGVELYLHGTGSSPYYRAVIRFPSPQEIKSIFFRAEQPTTSTSITNLCATC